MDQGTRGEGHGNFSKVLQKLSWYEKDFLLVNKTIAEKDNEIVILLPFSLKAIKRTLKLVSLKTDQMLFQKWYLSHIQVSAIKEVPRQVVSHIWGMKWLDNDYSFLVHKVVENECALSSQVLSDILSVALVHGLAFSKTTKSLRRMNKKQSFHIYPIDVPI